jgi:hypothetical protein
MRKNMLAALSLVICRLLVAQQAATPAASTPVAQTQAPSAPPPPHTLLDGTPVKLRLSQSISSADAKVGQEVAF